MKIVGMDKRKDIATVMTSNGLFRTLEEKNVATISRFAVRYTVSISKITVSDHNSAKKLIGPSDKPLNVMYLRRSVNHMS